MFSTFVFPRNRFHRTAPGAVLAAAFAIATVSAQESGERSLFAGLFGSNSSEAGVRVSTHTTRTRDGWGLSLNRYRMRHDGTGKPTAAVILCHGFNINNQFWDLDENTSLARYLAERGYEVWAPSLRGSGRSSKPLISRVRGLARLDTASVRDTVPSRGVEVARGGWTVDDHVRYDVPAIVEYVREQSGFDQVYWIGHSMGGIIMFAYLETAVQAKIGGFVSVGSMMVLPDPLTPNLRKIANQEPILTASLLINTTIASQLSNITLGAVKSPIEAALLTRSNVEARTLRRFLRNGIDDTSPGVVGQFADSIRAGEMRSRDGGFSYTGNLFRVTVPILFIAGSADGFVTPGMLRASYDAVGSSDKEIVLFSKANGASTDYGHCDLLIGVNSRRDVFPRIRDWLDRKAVPHP